MSKIGTIHNLLAHATSAEASAASGQPRNHRVRRKVTIPKRVRQSMSDSDCLEDSPTNRYCKHLLHFQHSYWY